MAKSKYIMGDTTPEQVYEITVTVYQSPAEKVVQRGTLVELSWDWPIIDSLINWQGKLDDGMLYNPLRMDLTVGWAHYKLEMVED